MCVCVHDVCILSVYSMSARTDCSHDPLPLQDLETIIRASHQLQDSKVFKDVLEVGRSGHSLLVLGE